MKKYLFMLIAGLIFLNVWSAKEVSAQGAKSVEAEIGFDFRVGERVFPAGVYRLETVGAASENILQLRGAGKKYQRLIAANALYVDQSQPPKLVFVRLGGEYYLSNIFLTDGRWGYSMPRSRRQKERERNLASVKTVEVKAKN